MEEEVSIIIGIYCVPAYAMPTTCNIMNINYIIKKKCVFLFCLRVSCLIPEYKDYMTNQMPTQDGSYTVPKG